MNRGPSSPPNPRSVRKARERKDRLDHVVNIHGVDTSTHEDCPHGTERGYVEYGCRCIDLGRPQFTLGAPTVLPMPWGCAQAGSQGSSLRRKIRRVGNAETQPLEYIERHPDLR